MIYILTGDIRTGKTTALLDWTSGRNDVDGLLCPDNENGKRYFIKIKFKETFELEVAAKVEIIKEDIVEIGKFKFLKSAFEKGNDYLISTTSEEQSNYIIIDEVGRLELRNEGLHNSTKILIPAYLNNENQHLILVVRDYLFEEVLAYYSISEYSILSKEELKKLD